MIVDGILNLLYALLSPLVNAAPVVTMPAAAIAGGETFRAALLTVDQFVPVMGPLAFWAYALVTTIPALIAWRVGVFIFNKVRGA